MTTDAGTAARPQETFLFSDVEGSTRMLEADVALAGRALDEMIAIAEAVVTRAGGRLFKTMGDGLCASFPTAPGGVSAAVALQRALAAHAWTGVAPLRVRMAVHTGEAEARGGDYFGPALFRVARLLALAHGGQLLLSNATATLVRGALPDGTTLVERGTHRLKDLEEPEQVCELLLAEGSGELRPLRSGERNPNNLPVTLTSFLGREAVLGELGGLVQRHPLTTLTGPGGTGKTRLAIEAGHRLLARFPGGAWFVDLSTVRDPARVPDWIAAALDVADPGDGSLEAAILERLGGEPALLVLDNLEQLPAAGPVVARLLAGAPALRVIATSRVPIHVSGERELRVEPLAVDASEGDARHGRPGPAVRLFLERARSVRPGLVEDPDTVAAAETICHRLDGLPLAIELAAARARLFSLPQLAARLRDRLGLLESRGGDGPERHRTLRAAIAWSEELLPERDRLVFRRLAVGDGSLDLAAVAAITGLDEDETLDAVSTLVEHSLVRTIEDSEDVRIGMLETIHDWAHERLAAGGDEAVARQRHATHFGALARGELTDRFWADVAGWLAQVRVERANLEAALGEAVRGGMVNEAAAIGVVLGRWFNVRMEPVAARSLLEPLAAATVGADPILRGRLLNTRSAARNVTGDPRLALDDLREAEAAFVVAGNAQELATVRMNIAMLTVVLGNVRDSLALFHGLVDDPAVVADPRKRRHVLTLVSSLAIGSGDVELGVATGDEAMRLAADLGPWERLNAATSAGSALAVVGRWEEAERVIAAAATAADELASPAAQVIVEALRAALAWERGDAAATVRLASATVTLDDGAGRDIQLSLLTLLAHAAVETGDAATARSALATLASVPPDEMRAGPSDVAAALDAAAALAVQSGDPPAAVRLLEAAEHIRVVRGVATVGRNSLARDRVAAATAGVTAATTVEDPLLRTLLAATAAAAETVLD